MKRISLKEWDRIELDWIDSIASHVGWRSPEAFDWKDHDAALYHKAIGYYISDDKLSITICQAYAVNNDKNFVGAFTIPKGCIQKIRRLK